MRDEVIVDDLVTDKELPFTQEKDDRCVYVSTLHSVDGKLHRRLFADEDRKNMQNLLREQA